MSWPWSPNHYPKAAYNVTEEKKESNGSESEKMDTSSTFGSFWNDLLEFGRKHLKKETRR